MQESRVFWSLDTGTTYTRVTEGGNQIQIPGRPTPTPFRSSLWKWNMGIYISETKQNQPTKQNKPQLENYLSRTQQ